MVGGWGSGEWMGKWWVDGGVVSGWENGGWMGEW